MKANPNNPYQDKEGNPKPGELRLFLDWERENELVRRQDLNSEERTMLQKCDNNLSAKMNS